MFNPLDPIGSILNWMLKGAVEGWKQACKYALQAGAFTDGQWQTAADIVGKVAGVMSFVCVGTGAIAIIMAVAARRFGRIWTILCQVVYSWPLTLVTLYLVLQVDNLAASLTGKILNVDLSKPKVELKLPDLPKTGVKGVLAAPMLLFLCILIVLAALAIMCCMAARQFLLIIGVCLVSTAWMLVGVRGILTQAKRYLTWILGIILYQPLCAMLIQTTGTLMEKSGSDNVMTFLVAAVGMVLSSVFPWVIVSGFMKLMPAMQSGLSSMSTASRQTVGKAEETIGQATHLAAKGADTAGAFATGGAGAAFAAFTRGGGKHSGAAHPTNASTASAGDQQPAGSGPAGGNETGDAGAASGPQTPSDGGNGTTGETGERGSMPAGQTPTASGDAGLHVSRKADTQGESPSPAQGRTVSAAQGVGLHATAGESGPRAGGKPDDEAPARQDGSENGTGAPATAAPINTGVGLHATGGEASSGGSVDSGAASVSGPASAAAPDAPSSSSGAGLQAAGGSGETSSGGSVDSGPASVSGPASSAAPDAPSSSGVGLQAAGGSGETSSGGSVDSGPASVSGPASSAAPDAPSASGVGLRAPEEATTPQPAHDADEATMPGARLDGASDGGRDVNLHVENQKGDEVDGG